jgi:hypothetical protein
LKEMAAKIEHVKAAFIFFNPVLELSDTPHTPRNTVS